MVIRPWPIAVDFFDISISEYTSNIVHILFTVNIFLHNWFTPRIQIQKVELNTCRSSSWDNKFHWAIIGVSTSTYSDYIGSSSSKKSRKRLDFKFSALLFDFIGFCSCRKCLVPFANYNLWLQYSPYFVFVVNGVDLFKLSCHADRQFIREQLNRRVYLVWNT